MPVPHLDRTTLDIPRRGQLLRAVVSFFRTLRSPFHACVAGIRKSASGAVLSLLVGIVSAQTGHFEDSRAVRIQILGSGPAAVRPSPIRHMAVNDSSLITQTWGGGVVVWDLTNGRPSASFSNFQIEGVFISDATATRAFATFRPIGGAPAVPTPPPQGLGAHTEYGLINMRSNSVVWRSHTNRFIRSAAGSGDLGLIAVLETDLYGKSAELVLVDGTSGRRLSSIPMASGELASMQLSPDARQIAILSYRGQISVCAVELLIERRCKQLTSQLTSNLGMREHMAFSPDSRTLVLVGTKHVGNKTTSALQVWDVERSSTVAQREIPDYSTGAISLSRDGNLVALTSDRSSEVVVWDKTSKALRRFMEIADEKIAVGGGVAGPVAFSPDQRFLFATRQNGLAVAWEVATGRWLAQFGMSFVDTWVVVDRRGRFDSNNVSRLGGIHLLRPDDPARAVPLDSLAQNQFEPKLLSTMLAGTKATASREKSTSAGNLGPLVTIQSITPTPGEKSRVDLLLKINAGRPLEGGASMTSAAHTVIRQVYVFRFGQLVRVLEVPAELQRKLVAGGEGTMKVPPIGVFKAKEATSLDFMVYGFTESGAKSESARMVFNSPPNPERARSTAFIVSIGVGSHQNPAWNLRNTERDARVLNETLSRLARSSGAFAEVVSVLVTTESVHNAVLPTKENIKTIFDRLNDGVQRQIGLASNLNALRPASIADAVLVTFSGHGFADQNGMFHLMTHDNGPGNTQTLTKDLVARSISSTELSNWFANIDAAQIAMIIDSCYAAAALGQKDVFPGPSRDPGLGQLALNKKMRILAGSERDQRSPLFEEQLPSSLLVYSLVDWGLHKQGADFKPRDGRIMFSEWLAYPVDAVPDLWSRISAKRSLVQPYSGQGRKAFGNLAEIEPDQQPRLFDFSDHLLDLEMMKVR